MSIKQNNIQPRCILQSLSAPQLVPRLLFGDETMAYTYKDFETGKIRKTSGRFEGWTDKTGLLNVRYAIFHRPKSSLFIPEYCLTKETRQKLSQKSNMLSADAKIIWQQLLA